MLLLIQQLNIEITLSGKPRDMMMLCPQSLAALALLRCYTPLTAFPDFFRKVSSFLRLKYTTFMKAFKNLFSAP